ncbi:Sensor histidine kinase MalK [uncultured Sporomusa sp.]|uniref:histidine kinase n=1 Tax=uncultured Sporomusa sp. TaxID=307249 RepID=A0A212LXE9_9FIRM|nr:Sensor histidine kinase MalK [uncultured Sporomusa sp.]
MHRELAVEGVIRILDKLSLQGKIIILVCSVVLLALAATNWLISERVAEDITQQMGRSVLYVARTVAQSTVVAEGLVGIRGQQEIQEYANSIRRLTEAAIVVVFDMDGIRKSHPDESKLGQHVIGGDELRSLNGQEYLSFATGTVGPSLRAFTPVYYNGNQVGAVVVGIHVGDIEQAVAANRNRIFIAMLLGMTIGTVGAILLARSVKKTLFGLEPAGIAKLLEERNAMLHSVKEGVLAVDLAGRITLANETAARMLLAGGNTGDSIGRYVDDCVPNTGLTRVLKTGLPELDREQDLNGIHIITNRVPILVDGTIVGAIATFRDKTEISQLAEELTGIRSYVEALRSQAHEFMNKLHVILGLVRLESYDQLTDYIKRIAGEQEAEAGFIGKRIKNPVIAGLVLSKLSKSREMGACIIVEQDTLVPSDYSSDINHGLVTILGNLLDNALEAVQSSTEKTVSLLVRVVDGKIGIRVRDSGLGLSTEIKQNMFQKGFSTKAQNRGFGLYLVNNSVQRLQGSIVFKALPQGTEVSVVIPVREEDKSL